MQFISFYTPNPSAHQGPPSKQYMEQMNKLIEESMKSGELVATGGLTPIQQGVRIVQASGNVTITDGPYRVNRDHWRLRHPRAALQGGSD